MAVYFEIYFIKLEMESFLLVLSQEKLIVHSQPFPFIVIIYLSIFREITGKNFVFKIYWYFSLLQ